MRAPIRPTKVADPGANRPQGDDARRDQKYDDACNLYWMAAAIGPDDDQNLAEHHKRQE